MTENEKTYPQRDENRSEKIRLIGRGAVSRNISYHHNTDGKNRSEEEKIVPGTKRGARQQCRESRSEQEEGIAC
jgi:hypothetical protein